MPVAFVQTPVDAEVLAILEHAGIVAIAASDWEQREFTVDPETVKRAFSLNGWSPAVDPHGFSAPELWWMTAWN